MADTFICRRFQFSLRTLLLVVPLLAVPCAYIAHEARTVTERRAILKLVVDRGGQVNIGADDPPLVRRILGDVGSCSIVYPLSLSAAEKSRIHELFPDDWIGPDITHFQPSPFRAAP
ncbi:MAG TPA: hypothetical protein VGP63_06160 [Planctomycetaceae bacterium]|jgi:hypothetical protein|nr:hypothetical protein [Planctomycetaceae bacterium]